MKVLIVSDTHGRHAGIEEAIQREFPFQRLIHLGDAEGYEDYIADLAECPIDIVSGNNDFFSDLPDGVFLQAGHLRLGNAHLTGHLHLGLAVVKPEY